MSMSLKKLERDFRAFDETALPYPLSKRIVNPVLFIEKQADKYVASLGAKVKKGGGTSFIACPSNLHNWLFDGCRLKPLPHDAPVILSDVLSGTDLAVKELKFPQVLKLVREGIEGIDIDVDPVVFQKANICSQKMSLSSVPELKADLYPYQKSGVAWMLNALDSMGGGILADEMGLGKTLQIIALFLARQPSVETPALIVCPTTLITNWCREIDKFAPSLTYIVHRGAERTGYYKDLMRSQVVVTTYDTLVNDISLFRGIYWSFVVCDEAQAVKNPESKRRRALGMLTRKYSIPVTGTPVENSLMDLWSLGDLAIPGLLGEKTIFSTFYPDNEEGASQLSEVVDAIILKRQVKHVASDLPARTDIDFPVELDSESQMEYERIRAEAVAEYGTAGPLVAVGQLAIYCAHPWLRMNNTSEIDWEDNIELQQDSRYSLLTPKMKVCIQLLKEAFITGKKVLIFATYNHCGSLLRRAALQEGLPQAYWNDINGATPQAERQVIVDDFSSYSGPAVLVLNPKAAGAGLNITAATIVIHYTQNWNPALEMQASARAYRRGQDNPVTIYRLYYTGTVEEAMVERSQWKRDLGNTAVPISLREKQDLDKALSLTPLLEK